jgi:flagella basal body P-ring formation protein FlgA
MQDATGTIQYGNKQRGGRCRRWLVRPTLTAGLLVPLLAGGSVAGVATQPAGGRPSDSPDVTVQLLSTAIVSGEQITLADLAEVRGAAGQTAARWPIMPAPRPGASCTIDLGTIQKALSDRGANLAYWSFRGHSRCAVRRALATAAQGTPQTPVDKARNSRVERDQATDNKAPMASMDPEFLIDRNTLGGALYEHLRGRLAKVGGIPAVEFPKAINRQLGLSRPTYEFAITARGEQLLGLVPLEVTVTDGKGDKQVLQMTAKVSLRKPVVVSARQINRNETIASGDLVLQEQVFDRIDEIGLTETAPVVGQRAKRFIDKGEQVQARDFEPTPLVHRNDLVFVLISRGNVRIKGVARALGTGGHGDVIEVKNEMGGRSSSKFAAVIVGEKTVEVQDARPTTTAPAVSEKAGA